MAFAFDLETAIDEIAILEAAISTPAPGITTAYGWQENPGLIDDPTLLPAVVHFPRGESNLSAIAVRGSFQASYQIMSVALFIEIILGDYPAGQGDTPLFGKSIIETFLNFTNQNALCEAVGASSYTLSFPDFPSYREIPWPPPPAPPIKWYWGQEYFHTFTYYGG